MYRMSAVYNSTFPTTPPADHDDPASIARHDQTAFEQVDRMLCHWDRSHRRSYHWMITLDEQPRAIDLSQRCQEFLPTDGLDLIPPESLHLTVRRFGYADEVDNKHLAAAVNHVGEHCEMTNPFQLQLVPLAGSPGAIRFSVAPWSPLLALHRAVSAASGYGEGDPLIVYRPHVGIAYSNRPQPSGPFVEAARGARSTLPSEIVIDELHLVELSRFDRQYRWHVLERLPFLHQAR